VPTGRSGLLNKFLPDVFIYTDHFKGAEGGASPGYGVTLVAESTSGCLYGAQRSTGKAAGAAVAADGTPAPAAAGGAGAPELPEDMGAEAAALLLDEVSRGGCIDTATQPLLFTLMALCSEDVSRVRIGQLGPPGIATLRLLKTFFGITFKLKPEVQDAAAVEAAAASARAASRHAAAAAGDSDEDGDGTFGEDGERGGRGRKRKFGELYGGKEVDESALDDDDADGNGAAGRQPLTAETRGGHSGGGKTVLVSCLGIGYKNFAKKVT
jgi:hypothetical protein